MNNFQANKTILGLDLGEKRIGVAISQTGEIAQNYQTIKFSNESQAVQEILNICQNEKVKKIIIGKALTLSGKSGFEVHRQENFIKKLKSKIKNIKIFRIDERLTTREAERILKELNLSKSKFKNKKDQLSAQIILQTYLDSQIK